MKRLRVWASVWLICLFALAACKEDDGYVYPSVLTEFIDARTDYSGTLFQLISDDGTILSIRQRSGLDGLVKDTVYRTVSVYEREGDGEVYLYSAQLVLSMFPVTEDYFKDDIKTDPVGIRSIWQSGNYLNMILTPLVKDQNHAYHFVDYGIVENDGTKALRLGLYHDRNKDTGHPVRKFGNRGLGAGGFIDKLYDLGKGSLISDFSCFHCEITACVDCRTGHAVAF